jgi:hypothetical protein
MRLHLPVVLSFSATLIACDPTAGDGKVGDDPIDSAAEGDADADADGDTDSDADGDSDSDADSDADADVELSCEGFSATATEWTLPTLSGDFSGWGAFYSTYVSGYYRNVAGSSEYYYTSTLDLTGDGLQDLVVTLDQADSNVGNKYWLVYKGGASGFSTTATKWALPTLAGDFSGWAAFYATNVAGYYRNVAGSSEYYYSATTDLTGDGVPDLVLTLDQADSNVGNKYWLVYEGGASGFSTTATKWTLPTLAGDFSGWAAFYSTYVSGYYRNVAGSSEYYYTSTLDLTGDGLQDLVVTLDQADSDVGNKHWLVYKGGASGFSTTATKWALPTLAGDFSGWAAFYSTYVSGYYRNVAGSSEYYYTSTLDLTGDGLQDLVVTLDQADSDVGNKHWLVYKGGASGFSTTATKWTLPTLAGDFSGWAAFYSTYVSGYYRNVAGSSEYYYTSTLDLTGDGLQDLVVTLDQADSDVGNKHWLVYKGGASGFSTTAKKWALPTLSGDFSGWGAYFATNVAGQYRNVAGSTEYYYSATMDLTGDGGNDLVLTLDQVDADIGNKHWLVYEGLCE